MAPMKGGWTSEVAPQEMPEAYQPAMAEGISLVLSRWPALQTAVEKGWGGRDSHCKPRELAAALLSWFAHSKVPHHVDDLESILDEFMVLSFNTEVEDGSIEEVSEQLMIMHEDILQGNYGLIEVSKKIDAWKHRDLEIKQVIGKNHEHAYH